MSKLLEVKNADVIYKLGLNRTKKALHDISLAVGGEQPSITAVVGESGSGKSTLIRLLLGLQPPSRGNVRYDGMEVAHLNGTRKRTFRREVQAIFQDPFSVYNPFYRIDHALVTPMCAFGIVQSHAEGYVRIKATLERVGLRPDETLGKYPHQLSGGQRQRVMIARALLLDPQIILADEPVSMVDASLRSTILEIFFGLNRDLGISLIYITHDLATAYQIADTIIVLHGGHILEVGNTDAVIHRPRHPYTKELIEAVPSPNLDLPWNLEAEPPSASIFLPTGPIGLYHTEALRAVAQPLRNNEAPTTAAVIQDAIKKAQLSPRL